MIPTIYFGIGFIIYISYTIFTFETYLKKEDVNKFLVIIMIFSYYSLLAGYLIFLVDDGSFMEKIIQTLIYIVIGAIFLYINYKDKINLHDNSQISYQDRL